MSEPLGQRSPKKERSPRYPSIDLEAALARAEQLWQREGRNYAPVPAILEAWNYSPKSSGGLLAIAALKRFGLIEDRGSTTSREARLTDLARAIVIDAREDPTERQERIRQAALTPTIHREILEKYADRLPSPSTLRYYLVNERGFTEAGAAEFVDQFLRTLEFAGLTSQSATVSPNEEDKTQVPSGASGATGPTGPQGSGGSVGVFGPSGPAVPAIPFGQVAMPPTAPPPIQFPVFGGTVIFQSTAPLTKAAYDQMMSVLKLLEPSIVAPEPFRVQLGDVAAKVSDETDE